MDKFYFGYPEGNIDWLQVVPETLYYGPKFLYERYKRKFYEKNGVLTAKKPLCFILWLLRWLGGFFIVVVVCTLISYIIQLFQ